MKKRVWFIVGAAVLLLAVSGVLVFELLIKNTVTAEDFLQPQFSSQNAAEGATVVYETLKKGERPDAANLVADGDSAWTPRDIARKPGADTDDVCNAAAELLLKQSSAFNTALIEETGDEVQHFRLQAYVGGGWQTVYQSEKIEALRLCSFDAVETDRVRLVIDKFRGTKPAKIKSLKLYNEPAREVNDFNVTVYQRLDGDVPSEVLKRSIEEIKTFARYYDVYNTVLIFGAVNWKNGEMTFNVPDGEAGFARELDALRQIIEQRQNKEHKVKIVCTALADGAGGNGHTGVNVFMAEHWRRVADQMVDFLKKYDLDGLDVDWEYPSTKDDWACYDSFIARLDDGMKAFKPDAVLSAALSAWSLGMSKETLARFDQIQYMAYDGNDKDGYQSSLDQAQRGLLDFIGKGVNPKRINIGIAAYGRPLNSAPYWANWRDVQGGDDLYWHSMQYNVTAGDQLFDAAFCAPALAGDKTAYALLSGVGGVMVFRLACDKTMDDPNSVACGIENALKRYLTKW
ncbi:MAG: glycoside hydrolase family 18 protein [Clostridiales bacterium]|jgi:hypothetical protein|nr:glycoside hydrolase family 18 protein [Clostridiales bacterium]